MTRHYDPGLYAALALAMSANLGAAQVPPQLVPPEELVTDVNLIPRTVLFGNPERMSPRLSPDAARLAFLAPHDDVLNVWVGKADGSDAHVVTNDTDRGIRNLYWAHDGVHLLYLQDTGGDENWQLYATNVETLQIRSLTPFEKVQVQVLELDKHFPDVVMLGINDRDPQLHDVYKCIIATGELELVEENPGFIGWVLDANLKARAAVTPTDDGGFELYVRDTGDGAEWRNIATVSIDDSLTTSPLAFSLDGSKLYALSSVNANAAGLVSIDVASGEATVIVRDDHYDIANVRIHPDTREVQLVVFNRDRADYLALDPAIADDIAAIRSFRRGDPVIEGNDDADTKWIVSYTTDDGPIAYTTYDRATKKSTLLFTARPVLEDFELAQMEPFWYETSDGLTVHGYLTFPVGHARVNLPMVLLVHGGPWARDNWGYDPQAQWLANRGYLCVQVNYRGSTGYGKNFVNAGDREWGAKMHQDLVDAVSYAVKNGYADESRIGIFGGSYGGYAALVGATFTPDLFACAVDIVGPSNLKTLIESIPPYWAPLVAQFHRRIGDPTTEADLLWERSPLSRVDDIRIPMMIAQGANDPRVKQAESEQIVAAMKAKGIPHQYLLYPDEGHGFGKPENRLDFMCKAEAFLAEHLGGRLEP